VNIKDIKELILAIDKTSIQKVDIENKDVKISISKGTDNQIKHTESPKTIEVKDEGIEELKHDNVENDIVTDDDKIYVVKSPIVGVFYKAPSPGAEPFVKVGDTVDKGQTLCIIEAMKIMNEIESEVSGEIVEILVENEGVVEYGQPLMKIRR
jgi:acetyl-CoA carboxylase biotin carboxyl carrier protein